MVVETAEKLISALGDIGIPASIDPPALNPPCAWIAARKLRARNLHGGFQIEFDIYLIARDTGIPESIRVLDSMLFEDRKSTRLNSSHVSISYAVFCLKKKK